MDDHSSFSGLSESIIKALLYYDLFNHPLTADEIFRNLPTNHVTQANVNSALAELISQSVVFRFGDYYSVQQNPDLESRRVKGGRLAEKHMKIAAKKAQLINRFPFVRSVMLSGSLSKGYADEKSDIDFFVITKQGRLWITRGLLGIYRRIFLLNSHKHFCVNYFIDENHLEIEERNRFTATELTTLIPLSGIRHHTQLMTRNSWILEFMPNFKSEKKSETLKPSPFKSSIEWLMDHFFPETLDSLLMRFAQQRWQKMYSHTLDHSEFNQAFKTQRHVSKGHPNAYQNKILRRYEERLKSFSKSLQVNIPS